MNKLPILILTIITLLGCSKEDESSNNQIIGEWKLVEAQFNGFEGQKYIDYSSEEIIYHFQSNGILKVTGGKVEVGYKNGEYEYFFGKEYLSGAPTENETKTLLVIINSNKWTYNFTNGEMKLGQSYIDGADLMFIQVIPPIK